MKHDDSALRSAIVEAAECVRAETGASAWAAFEALVPADAARTRAASHAVGLIAGAALALGMTPIELLDELDVPDQE